MTHIGTFRALLDAGALDVLRLDVLAIGGVTPARARAGARGRARTCPCRFHVYPEVSVHLAAGDPGAIVETFDPDLPGGNPLDPAHLLSHAAARCSPAGCAVAPDVPGLGFELDWACPRFRPS